MNQHWILSKREYQETLGFFHPILASLVLIQIILPIKGHFEVESWIGFGLVWLHSLYFNDSILENFGLVL